MGRRGNPNWARGASGAGRAPGRKKGAKNRLTRDLVDHILEVAAQLENNGKSLYDEAKKAPVWFYENFYKALIPKNINLTADQAFEIEVFIGPLRDAKSENQD